METGSLIKEIVKLRAQIRSHRDAKGNDRCWENDVALYKLLPEPLPEEFTPEMPPACEFMLRCAEYRKQQAQDTEIWISVEYDINLTHYVEAFLQYKHDLCYCLDDVTPPSELEMRMAFHLLTLEQKLFMRKIGIYTEEAGALPKE